MLLVVLAFVPLVGRAADAMATVLRSPATSGAEFGDPKPWSAQSELSFLATQGNTDTLSIGVKTSVKRNWTFWALQARGEYLQNRDGQNVIAESYLFGTRGTRKFLGFDVFSDLEYQSNKFAGFVDLYKIAFGVGKEFCKTETQAFRFEVGPAFVIERRTNGTANDFSSLSAQLLHQWTLANEVKFNDRLAYLGNLEDMSDSRYELEVGFAAPVSQLFSLKAAYLAQYRNLPPANVEHFDGKTTLSILATF